MAFRGLIENNKIINAFLFPEDDTADSEMPIKLVESVVLKSQSASGKGYELTRAFENINLFAVRLPALKLFEMYANTISGDKWFDDIVGFGKRMNGG